MSTSVPDYQKTKAQGSSVPNGPKDHRNEQDELDSWRNHQQHHQAYSTPSSDPYMSSYYGAASFQYQAPFDGNTGPWSTNGSEMGFLGSGYSAPHEHPHPHSGHYNVESAMFSGGGSGGFSNVGNQTFGYGFHGNGDYNTWGRKPYDEYYRDGMYGDERGMKMMEHGMGGLSLGDKDSGKKTTTWASVASQPAKTQSLLKKKAGMPPPPIMLSTWETKNGTVAKAPIAAPVQAPRPPVWERMERPPSMPPQTGPSALLHHPSGSGPSIPSGPPSGPIGPMMGNSGPGRGGLQQQHQHSMGYMPPLSQTHPSPAPSQTHSRGVSQSSSTSHSSVGNRNSAEPKPVPLASQPQYPDEARMKSEYNPSNFELTPSSARFFVIKSYSEDDIHRSIKYEIWCSTDHGNKRLDQSYRDSNVKGPIYLFFSVNSSGHFCGMAQMTSEVDYDSSSSVWSQNKWKGQFKVKWVYVKDVPNSALRHIRLENNENKPVTNSRDTQEVPFDKGLQVLKIIHSYPHTTSIFDDFVHYEKRQEEEDQRRTTAPGPSTNKQANSNSNFHDRDQNERGGHHGRGSHHSSNNYGSNGNDFHRDNPRDHRDNRDRDHERGSGHYGGGIGRIDHRGGGGGMSRGGQYGGGMSRGGERDRGFDSHVHDRDRDRDHYRGGGSRGRGGFRS